MFFVHVKSIFVVHLRSLLLVSFSGFADIEREEIMHKQTKNYYLPNSIVNYCIDLYDYMAVVLFSFLIFSIHKMCSLLKSTTTIFQFISTICLHFIYNRISAVYVRIFSGCILSIREQFNVIAILLLMLVHTLHTSFLSTEFGRSIYYLKHTNNKKNNEVYL